MLTPPAFLTRVCTQRPALPMALVLCIATVVVHGTTWAAEPVSPPELQSVEQLYRTEGPEAALPAFQRLADEFRQSGDRRSEAVATRFIGEIHWRLGEFEKANGFLQQAMAIAVELTDPAQQARVLNVMGLLQWDLGNYEQALEHFGVAGGLAAQLGDSRLQGAVLNNAGLVHDERGDYLRSLDSYQQALSLYDTIDFPRGRGDTLGNIGGVYLLLGRYTEALDYYQRALAISEELGSVTSMGQDVGNIALCQLGLGNTVLALEYFERAIALAEQAGSRQDVAFWTRGMANALVRTGELDNGLKHHRRAIADYQELGARGETVEAMYDLGRLYLAFGDSGSAGQWFDDSLGLASEIGLQRGVTLNLLAKGDLQWRRQAPEAAAALYAQAVQRARESGELGLAVESLLRLSAVHQEQQEFDDATLEAQDALETARSMDSPWAIAGALLQLGNLERLRDDPEAALDQYRAARSALPDPVDPELAWRIHHGTGLALAGQGDFTQAVDELRRAIAYIEGVRDRLEEQRFRSGFLQDRYQVYVDLVRIQLKAGAEGEAFSTAERLRARSYLDLLDRESPAELTEAEQQAMVEMRERIRRLRRALNEETNRQPAQQRQPALVIYSAELLAAEREYEALLADQGRAQGIGQPAAAPSHEDIRARLRLGEALVEFVVADPEVMIFVINRDGLKVLTSPLSQRQLHSKVELLRDLLRHPGNDRWRRPAASLATALIEPLQSAGALVGLHHLFLVPHGSLNYLPFAMLPGIDGQRPLVEDYTLAYLPTAAALPLERTASPGLEHLLAVAPARSGLRHAPEEVSRVFELFGAESRLLVGEIATESLFKQMAGQFDVLHLATHGYFNKVNPMLSGLELEADEDNDGLLELHEIARLDLHADLVTLSACDTGLGSGHFAEVPPGDDFVSLTRAFLGAGSNAVMATLWEVDDASTANLMQHFYTRLRVSDEKRPGAAALADAQRRLRANPQYQHPYYWAPFVLVGANHPLQGHALGAGT